MQQGKQKCVGANEKNYPRGCLLGPGTWGFIFNHLTSHVAVWGNVVQRIWFTQNVVDQKLQKQHHGNSLEMQLSRFCMKPQCLVCWVWAGKAQRTLGLRSSRSGVALGCTGCLLFQVFSFIFHKKEVDAYGLCMPCYSNLPNYTEMEQLYQFFRTDTLSWLNYGREILSSSNMHMWMSF